MNYSNYSFTLDLQIHQSQISIPVSLKDTARKLYITFINGRKPYTIPDGCRAIFVGFKPDETTLFNDCIIQENKTVIYEFTEQTANVEGIVNCEIRLYGKDGKQLTSSQFIMIVDENVTRDISLSENESTAIDNIIHAEIGRVEAEAEREAAEKIRNAAEEKRIETEEEIKELANVLKPLAPFILQTPYLDDLDRPCYILDIGKEYKGEAEEVIHHSLIGYFTGGEGSAYTPYIFAEQPIKEFTIKIIGFEDGILTYEYNGKIRTYDCSVNSELTPPYELQRVDLVWRGDLYLCNPEGIKGGEDGKDGKTPYIKDGNWWIGDTDTEVKAEGKDGKDGANGINGKDGISATHSWNGTTLTITSASGTSSADLKGADGKNGKDGKDGINGVDGHTPINGVDYNTPADKAEFSQYIASELAKRGQLKPEFANSIEECTDTTKVYVLPDGYIYAYVKKYNLAEPLFTNRLPLAIGSDGQKFNGGLGYQEGYRLQSSDGMAVEYPDRCVTGFIKAKKGDTIRTKGVTFISDSLGAGYDSSFAKSGTMAYPSLAEPVDGVCTFTAEGSSATIYIRLSAHIISEDAIITVNEEIAYSEPGEHYVWSNTGHAFVPADYEERIITLEDTAENHESRILSIEEQIESDNSELTNTFDKLFTESKNLYNSYNKVSFVVISSSGEEVQNYSYFSTERIAVKPSTNYTFSYFTYASWFDSDGVFIKRQDTGNTAAGIYVMTLVSPENAAYLIGSTATGINENTLDQQGVIQGIVEGDSFEGVGKYKATTLKTRDDFAEYQVGISQTDRYIFDMNIPNIFTTERTYEDENITSLTPTQVHSLFNEFTTTHPTYVTKTILGNNDSGEEIAYYTFNPEMANHENAIKVPTIFINCAIHGDEKEGTQAVYYAMKDIIDNWKTDETLELLRHNVKFIINPCANPDGWKNHTRKNGNGVDLARNFPAAWYGNSETTSPSYGGTEPLSEKESRFIKSILDSNKDISVTIDFHSFPDNDANVNLLYWYEPVFYGLPIHIATNFNNKMSRNYAKRFDWVTDGEFVGTTYIGGYRQYNFYGEDGGKLGQTSAIQYGQELSGTFEIKRSISQIIEDADYTQKYLRYSVEAIVNFICEMLKGISL